MTVGKALKEMFATYAKKPLLFSGIFLVVMLPLFIFQFLVGAGMIFGGLTMTMGDLGTMIISLIVYIVLMIVLGFVAGVLFFGGTIRAVSKVMEGKSVGFGECISYAFGKVWAYLGLTLRVFWYSLAWLFVLLMALYPVIMSVLAGIGINSAMAQGLIGPGDGPSQPVFDSSASGLASLFTGASLIYGIALLVLLVFVIIRSLKAMFSFYYLFDEENITTKDALKKSIELTKGNLWRIIGYYLVIVVLAGVVSWIVMSLTGSGGMTQMADGSFGFKQSNVSVIVSFLVNAIISPMILIYYFVFYKGLQSEKGAK